MKNLNQKDKKIITKNLTKTPKNFEKNQTQKDKKNMKKSDKKI